jgi:hypothetical protein
MKTFATRIALGLFIVGASLAASKAANAQFTTYVRWQNASTPGGNLYFMGVAGGPSCSGNRCSYTSGTQIILWAWGQNDQNWYAPHPGVTEHVVNEFGSPVSGEGYCLHPSGSTNNSNLVINPCTTGTIDNWTVKSAESLNPPAPFGGCFIFQNQLSGRVMAVYQGNVSVRGARVIEYDLCQPGSNVCGSPAGYHADQFWCPWNVQ